MARYIHILKQLFRQTHFLEVVIVSGIVWLTSVSCSNSDAQPTVNASVLTSTGSYYALSVPDLDASIKWYTEKFEMKVISRPAAAPAYAVAILEGWGLTLELVQLTAGVPLSTVAPSITQRDMIHGIYKVGIQVEDLNKVVELLHAKNIEILLGPFPSQGAIKSNLAIKDNNGNWIVFIGK